jgi:hypothetical protein
MSEAMTQEELEQRINKMSDEEQAHFKLLIYKLVMCYGEGNAQGVMRWRRRNSCWRQTIFSAF